jgi:hypothetical protein
MKSLCVTAGPQRNFYFFATRPNQAVEASANSDISGRPGKFRNNSHSKVIKLRSEGTGYKIQTVFSSGGAELADNNLLTNLTQLGRGWDEENKANFLKPQQKLDFTIYFFPRFMTLFQELTTASKQVTNTVHRLEIVLDEWCARTSRMYSVYLRSPAHRIVLEKAAILLNSAAYMDKIREHCQISLANFPKALSPKLEDPSRISLVKMFSQNYPFALPLYNDYKLSLIQVQEASVTTAFHGPNE